MIQLTDLGGDEALPTSEEEEEEGFKVRDESRLGFASSGEKPAQFPSDWTPSDAKDPSLPGRMSPPQHQQQTAFFPPPASDADAAVTLLNRGTEEESTCAGYRRSRCKAALAHLLSVALLGLPYLLWRWWPRWRVAAFHVACPLRAADLVLITDKRDRSCTVAEVCKVPVTDHFPERYTLRTPQPPSSSSSVNDDDNNDGGDDEERLLPAVSSPAPPSAGPRHHFFLYHSLKYVWDRLAGGFSRLRGLDQGHRLNYLRGLRWGAALDRLEAQLLHRRNAVDVPLDSYLTMLFNEVLNPFYIFQGASIVLWSFDDYYFFASCIFLLSAMSIAASLLETRAQRVKLHNMCVGSSGVTVSVRSRTSSGNEDDGDGHFEDVPSSSLVPGDVISIPAGGCIMTCDAVLLSGTCIVNEAMLTGESVPVTKTALPDEDGEDELYHIEAHKKHTVFAGTTVIQTRFYEHGRVLAVVMRTGFNTSKGELIRSMLHAPEASFKFYSDALRFIMVLFAVALVGMVYCVYVYVERDAPLSMILLRCLDIITIVVPPALPAAMTTGTIYAQARLKLQKIFCISPQRINMCGKVKLFCFDKTGTLTDEGLDLSGVVQVLGGEFAPLARDPTLLPASSPLLNCMAACHDLTLIDGRLCGDPVDIKMFESTRWRLSESGDSDHAKFDQLVPTFVSAPGAEFSSTPHEVGILKQFEFSSAVARMSVITRARGGAGFDVYTKGAPERLEVLCLPHTLPKDFHAQLQQYTLHGYRVLALAHRALPTDLNYIRLQKLRRDQVERELTFLGFMVMQNALKPETAPVIEQLRDAAIKTVMVTGDNLLTAVSVARDSRMVRPADRVFIVEASKEHVRFRETERVERREAPGAAEVSSGYVRNHILDMEAGQVHLAVSGGAWANLREYHPFMVDLVSLYGTVFARMGPDQKQQLVEQYQSMDYVTGMCGDGANDCSALKAAEVGISLSEAEASVAAPFTSATPDITCVPKAIREGRCALVTSFGVFKYMALYSMIQFVSVLMLYTKLTNLGDTQYLFIDLAITATVAVLVGRTGPYHRLVRRRPRSSLMAPANLFSILSQIAIALVFQVVTLLLLEAQPWYRPLQPESAEDEIIVCWETTAIFVVSSFQYLVGSMVFSKGPPYRQSIPRNRPFFISLVVLGLVTALLALYPGETVASFIQLEFDPAHPPGHLRFRLALLAVAAVNAAVAFGFEMLAESALFKRLMHRITGKTEAKNRFKRLRRQAEAEKWIENRVLGPQEEDEENANS